jgi:pentatricopeptide repeat protein
MAINLITYNSVITALSKASRLNARKASKEHASERFSDFNVEKNPSGATDIDEEQLWTRALQLLEQMRKEGVEPDGFSYSSAISCCGAGGKWKEALELIETMQKGGPRCAIM